MTPIVTYQRRRLHSSLLGHNVEIVAKYIDEPATKETARAHAAQLAIECGGPTRNYCAAISIAAALRLETLIKGTEPL